MGSAYVTLGIFIVAAIILSCIIAHLVYVANRKCKKKSNLKSVMWFLIVTLIGIISFLLSLLCIIAVIIQLILIDAHKLHPESNEYHAVYYSMFEELEYMIAIFDCFGHLCMIAVFIARFKICFENSIFGYSKILIRSLYVILTILILFSLVIIGEIIRNDQDTFTIIISEIIWEILIEFLCLWLLYLFITKLYKLLKMTLSSSGNEMQHRHKSELSLFNDLMDSMTPRLESNRSRSQSASSKKKSKSKSKSGNTKNDNKKSPEIRGIEYEKDDIPAMTIDNRPYEPASIANSAYNMDNIHSTERNKKQQTHSRVTIDDDHGEPMSFTINPSTIYHGGSIANNHLTEPDQLPKSTSLRSAHSSSYDPQITELVNVMNKMTLLVLIAVLSSILSVIGNIFIEIHELTTIAQHTVDVESMYAFLLPVTDMIITSFMLYLQFNFTQNVYATMCYEADKWFLKICLKLHLWILQKKDGGRDHNVRHLELNLKNKQKSVNTETGPTATSVTSGNSSKAVSTGSAASTPRNSNLMTMKDDGIEIVTIPTLTPANSQVLTLEAANSTCPLTNDISCGDVSSGDISSAN